MSEDGIFSVAVGHIGEGEVELGAIGVASRVNIIGEACGDDGASGDFITDFSGDGIAWTAGSSLGFIFSF